MTITSQKGLDALSIFIPRTKARKRPVERPSRLSEKRDRSVTFLVAEATLEYLDREEMLEATTYVRVDSTTPADNRGQVPPVDVS